jgi:hypothetical protein
MSKLKLMSTPGKRISQWQNKKMTTSGKKPKKRIPLVKNSATLMPCFGQSQDKNP